MTANKRQTVLEESGKNSILKTPMSFRSESSFPLVSLLVIQPTPFCNISCNYCYLPDRQSKQRISLDTIEQIFVRLFACNFLDSRLNIVWHAGEPLVVPLSFYRAAWQKIIALNKMQCQISHGIQTNGTLLTQEWCDFIKANNINIGVSLDGPAFLHNANRKMRSGRGTHKKVIQGITLLQQNHIDFHVITVLTRQALDYPDEIFTFFIENGITRVGFNIEETEGMNVTSSLESDGTEALYRNFMERMYELTKSANRALQIREFEWAHNLICNEPPKIQYDDQVLPFNDQVLPFNIITVDCEGNFSTFSPELLGHKSLLYGDFILGNVWTDTFESIVKTEKFRNINADMNAGIDLCRHTCEYFDLCGGGAPANKHFEKHTFRAAETMYCRYTIQTPIDVVLSEIERSFVPHPLEEL